VPGSITDPGGGGSQGFRGEREALQAAADGADLKEDEKMTVTAGSPVQFIYGTQVFTALEQTPGDPTSCPSHGLAMTELAAH
jgi:hypothetical protein